MSAPRRRVRNLPARARGEYTCAEECVWIFRLLVKFRVVVAAVCFMHSRTNDDDEF